MKFIFLLALFPLASFAAKVSYTTRSGEPVTIITYEEGGASVVEEIVQSQDGWPDLKRRSYFTSPLEKAAYLANNFFLAEEEAFSILALPTAGSLWKVKANWSWEWEQRFAAWIRAEVDAEFFVRHSIATDCADVAYALRWIFARIHGLPMASTLSGGQMMSHNTLRGEWRKLKTAEEWHQDDRFRAALNYLLNLTYTHSLSRDSYPVAIGPQSLLEGGFHLYLHDRSGHTQVISRVRPEGEAGLPIEIIQSTIPRAVRTMPASGYWATGPGKAEMEGLRRFRWPNVQGNGLVPAKEMPFYSPEQYAPNFSAGAGSFFIAVIKRVQPNFDLATMVLGLAENIRSLFIERLEIVREGFAFCQNNNCEPGSSGYENWSTPSRDKRIGGMMEQFSQIRWFLNGNDVKKIDEEFSKPFLPWAGKQYSLTLLQLLWQKSLPSVDPRVSPEFRWALTPEATAAAVRKKAETIWAEREKKIALHCLLKDCQPGSPLWKERSTSRIDLGLLDLANFEHSYCVAAGRGNCELFSAELEQEFAPLGKTLRSALQQFSLLSSDPRHSPERRRGNEMHFETILGEKWDSVTSSPSGLVFFGGSGQLWKASTKTELPPPAGDRWLAFRADSSEGWAGAGHFLAYVNFPTGEKKEIVAPFPVKSVLAMDRHRALFLGETEWALLEKESILAQGKFESLLSLGDKHLLVWLQGQAWLYDFTAAPTSVALNGLPANALYYPHLPTNEGWILRAGDMNWILRREDKVVVPVQNRIQILALDSAGREGIAYANGDWIFSLSPSGELKLEQKFEERIFANGSQVTAKIAGQTRAFSLKFGQLQELKLFPGENWIEDYDGLNVVAATKEGRIVRPAGGGSPILKSNEEIHFSLGQKPGSTKLLFCEPMVLEDPLSFYAASCRLEDLANPKIHSLFTGLSPYLGPNSPLSFGHATYVFERPIWFAPR